MSRFNSVVSWLSVTSEVSHFFCCGLPLVFSMLSLMSSMGLIVAVPVGLTNFHEMMHDYEVPMIIIGASILVLGWVLHFISYQLDCRSSGCAHQPCGTKKKKSSKILMVATGLYVLNVTAYFLLHH